MKHEYYECDRCKARIERPFRRFTEQAPHSSKTVSRDLCNECTQSFWRWLKDE